MSGTDMLEAAQSLHAFKETFFQPGSPAALESLSRWARSAGHPMLAAEAEMAARDTDAAEAEFNRMCIGPYRLTVPPYESVWRSHGRVLNNRYSAAVEYAFSEVGLTSHGKLNEMPDFFGNELEFLSCVASMSFQYRQKGDAAAADELEAIFRRFWSQHLGHWGIRFLTPWRRTPDRLSGGCGRKRSSVSSRSFSRVLSSRRTWPAWKSPLRTSPLHRI